MRRIYVEKERKVKSPVRTVTLRIRLVDQCGIIATVEAHLIGALFARLARTENDASESETASSRGRERSVGKWINA
jgi:hypothetical protein